MAKIYFYFFPFFIALLNLYVVSAQELPVKSIPQVVVEGNKAFFSDDQTTRTFNLSSDQPDRQQDIGNVLEMNSAAMIRPYGSTGSLTSISLHGTGSNHTQVNWNGIPLNSPTTGQVDLSLIPSGFIQSVEVVNGASGTLFGSGTFGGSVNLNSETDWNRRLSVNYSFNTGSYGLKSHLLSLGAGNRRIQYQISALTSKAENNFTYHDRYRYGSPPVENGHNAFKTTGIIQNVFLDLNGGNHIEGGLWYQHKTLEIPALMGSYKSSYANQKDSLFRSFLSYRKTGTLYTLMVKSAYLSDFLNYTDKLSATDSVYSLDSRIGASRLLNDADYRFYVTKNLIAGGGISFNRLIGKSNNYGGRIIENEFAVYQDIKAVFKEFIINAGVRKEFYKGLNPPIQYSFGFRYKPSDRVILRSSFSTKFRKPTFNEKYWKPGGNPLLRPEKGKGAEITADWNALGKKNSLFRLDTRITAYYQTVDNWIQWVIIDSLTPVEYKKVHASGLEAWIEYAINTGSLAIKGRINYNYNRSVIVSTYNNDALFEGNQLSYVPKHTLRTSSEAVFKGFSIGYAVSYTGCRETVETKADNLRLSPFTLIDFTTGYHGKINDMSMAVYFRIENVFDKSVEIIRSYPLPGRTFHLTMTIGLDKLNSEN